MARQAKCEWTAAISISILKDGSRRHNSVDGKSFALNAAAQAHVCCMPWVSERRGYGYCLKACQALRLRTLVDTLCFRTLVVSSDTWCFRTLVVSSDMWCFRTQDLSLDKSHLRTHGGVFGHGGSLDTGCLRTRSDTLCLQTRFVSSDTLCLRTRCVFGHRVGVFVSDTPFRASTGGSREIRWIGKAISWRKKDPLKVWERVEEYLDALPKWEHLCKGSPCSTWQFAGERALMQMDAGATKVCLCVCVCVCVCVGSTPVSKGLSEFVNCFVFQF